MFAIKQNFDISSHTKKVKCLPVAPVPYTRAGLSSRSALAYFAAETICIVLVIFLMLVTDFNRKRTIKKKNITVITQWNHSS